MSQISEHIRNNVVGYIALFVALSATAWAAPQLAKNSVKSKHIVDGQVKSVDVADDGLTGTDIDEATLNVSGTPGPQGATGAPGPQGATGPAGADGSPDTAAQILAKLLGVDGSGSNLDADTLDGQSSASFSAVGHTHSGGAGGSIVDGTITNDDISNSAAIAASKLNTQMGVMTGRVDGLSAVAGAQYGGVSGFTDATATEANVMTLSPNIAVTASSLAVRLTAAPGAGSSRQFTIRTGGIPTILSCTISGAATSCSNSVNTAVILSGGDMSLEIINAGTPAIASALFGFRLR